MSFSFQFGSVRQDFWCRSVAHLQRPCDVAGVFDKPYIVIFVCFDKWQELYAVVGWAFCAACGTDGSDYCAIKRTGPMYHEDADPLPLTTESSQTHQQHGASETAPKKRKRASPTAACTTSFRLPEIKVCTYAGVLRIPTVFG